MSHHHHHTLIGAALLAQPQPRTKGPAWTAPERNTEGWESVQPEAVEERGATLKPVNFAGRSRNELRPSTFDGMVGQERLKLLLTRIVDNAKRTNKALDHLLLAGSAGTGKTTFAEVIAHELGRTVYKVSAPVALDVFEALASQCNDRDVVIIDEIHKQVSGDRRGTTQAADPETYYSVMEDHCLETPHRTIPFPDVTIIGCTTDTGLLPEPFLARFPLQPPLDRYTIGNMTTLAKLNAKALDLSIGQEAAELLARASRRVPRIVNRYARNAESLNGRGSVITPERAIEIITGLNSTTLDGLDRDMTRMLLYLLSQPREVKGEVRYQASVNSIATATGHSRDTKTIALYTEPYLIERGFVAIAHGGRTLTTAGIERARKL